MAPHILQQNKSGPKWKRLGTTDLKRSIQRFSKITTQRQYSNQTSTEKEK